MVVAFGRAGGTFLPGGGKLLPQNQWETPAAWRAFVGGGEVVEWRVYCDNEPIRQEMRDAAARQSRL